MLKKLLLLLFFSAAAAAETITTTEKPAVAAEKDKDFWSIPNPWATPETGKVPRVKPYELPRFDAGHTYGDQHTQIAPLHVAPYVDGEAIFYATIHCFPDRSTFRLELELQAQYGTRDQYDLTNGQPLGTYYGAIVARMPLYSATEISREREREYTRRTATAAAVGNLMQALAERNHAIREMGIYQSLEARSQVRVLQGVADVSEQIGHLTKVAGAQQKLITSESDLVRHRLTLVGQCADEKADVLNKYLKTLTSSRAGK